MKSKKVVRFLLILLSVFGLTSIVSCDNGKAEVPPVEDLPTNPDNESQVKVLTCKEATDLANQIGEQQTDERFVVKGKVKEVINPTYGEMTIYDETGELYLYGTYSADGTLRYSEMTDKPYKGDDITVSTLLNTYKGKPQGKSSWITEFKHNVVTDDKTYTKMTISEARESKEGTGVELTGTVVFKTLGQKKIENGFYIVDGSNSIYVYDSQVTPRVQVGNKVTIKGTKEMFIATNEKDSAAKFGYTGSCQISNVTLVTNDEKDNQIDLSFAAETTVKEILNKPLNENFRTKIYKVNAFVKKVPGKGFTNYYINDLDNQTGSYVYTSNNGTDFAYLDQFDGKICTVYLSVINMKSTSTGCLARFIPIKVEDNNYKFDLTQTNQFVLDYVLDGLFLPEYESNIDVEVITSYSNQDLGINNVTIKYESLTPLLAKVSEINGKTIVSFMNPTVGVAKIKSTITFNEISLDHIFEVNMKETPKYNTVTINEGINKVGEKVILKGVAGPSLINQTGFYLIDETGAIAVRISKTDMELIKFGNLVTIEGVVTDYSNKANATNYGRVLNDSTLLLNENGEHNYSDKSFIKDKTFDDVYALKDTLTAVDTTKVFKFECKIKAVKGSYSDNYFVTSLDGTKEIIIYNNGTQSDYLKEFDGKTVTVEFAFCNYNNKSEYPGAILSVNDGTKTVYPMRNYK